MRSVRVGRKTHHRHGLDALSRALISPGLGFWNAKGFPLVDVGAAPA